MFLDDPTRRAWSLKAGAPDREHVESTIQTARADVDTDTETRGRPYALDCTKHQARFERRARPRVQDQEDPAALRSWTRLRDIEA